MKRDLQDFQKWLKSLQWRDLQTALEFPLSENDLLLSLLSDWAPPPTPIHAHALVGKEATRWTPTDGKDFYQRIRLDCSHRPRLFRLTLRGHHQQQQQQQQPRYTILARKFVTPDGERLSLGCTVDQRQADEALLQSLTVIVVDSSKQIVRVSTCHNILRLLHIASRGHLASALLSPNNKNAEFAAWFDPTQRWFSLSMYMASRLEVALWKSFYSKRQNSLIDVPFVGKPQLVEPCVHRAWVDVLRSMLSDESQYVRDSALWFVLHNVVPYYARRDSSHLAEAIRTLPLLELQTPRLQLQRQTAERLQVYVSQAVEAELLAECCETTKPTSKRKRKPSKTVPAVKEANVPTTLEEGDDEADDEPMETTRQTIEFRNSGTTARERNKNVVFVLSVLDGVVEEVFDQVGLRSEEESSHEGPMPEPSSEQTLVAAHDTTSVQVQGASSLNETPADVETPCGLEEPSSGEPSDVLVIPVNGVDPGTNRSPMDSFAAQYDTLGGRFFHRSEPQGYIWDLDDEAMSAWSEQQHFPAREQSLLTAFFGSNSQLGGVDPDHLMALSTAASVDSSSDIEQSEATDVGHGELYAAGVTVVDDEVAPAHQRKSLEVETDQAFVTRSPSPEAPATPPPTLSPTLVSLADLKDLHPDSLQGRSHSALPTIASLKSFSSVAATSLPSSPHSRNPRLVTSLSRENLHMGKGNAVEAFRPVVRKAPLSPHSLVARAPMGSSIAKSRDDHDLHGRLTAWKSTDALSMFRQARSKQSKSKDDHDIRQGGSGFRPVEPASYRAVASRALAKSGGSDHSPKEIRSRARMGDRGGKDEMCARSEIAPDGHEDYQNWHECRQSISMDEVDNNTVTKDGSTTITSALSHREPEEMSTLRDERNAYRDLCLTLGAEVAKLNNLLAAQRGAAAATRPVYSYDTQPFQGAAFFDPEAVSNPFEAVPRARTLAAMSDAGNRGDYESMASEDDTGAFAMTSETVRRMSSGATFIGSDNVSIERASLQQQYPPAHPGASDPVTLHGMQSRLAREILQFVETTNTSLKKLDAKRQLAVERITRLVKNLWPRAEMKLYGSHVTGLCLPSSDLDFVIRLPAVHKKAIAVAPGALEGRNAVNESLQKLLARVLKGESWIDPRSIRLIERTVVPVIKVATKDTRAKTIQLDITFEKPGHHGIEAVRMVSQIQEELPMARPLVLVLKQFLTDRGLLTAYTGGLSSYCLFLMVVRYLQEQPSAWGDCGALLLGFLDFYGNHFDPRSTGISVRRREYFPRPAYCVARPHQVVPKPSPAWNMPQFVSPGASIGNSNLLFRRYSFGGNANVDATRGGHVLARPPLFKPASPPQNQFMGHATGSIVPDHRIPYTFDPLWVEDPLSEGNNVGRNAFRYPQVQRAFSDAHRALVAALEWDIQSTGDLQDGQEYALLKSFLRSDDAVFEL